MKLRELKGFGTKSEETLARIGITSVEQFMQADPFVLYQQLKQQVPATSLNALYAMIGAQQGIDWREVARTQRVEILLKLDDLGLAPK